jgi:hypothetical protein
MRRLTYLLVALLAAGAMTFALRSLRTGGVTNPVLAGITLTDAPNGNFSPYCVPVAVQSGGKVFYAYPDGSNGNIEIAEADEATGANVATTVLHAALEADAHNCAAILVRSSDSRLVVIYGRHNNSDIYRRISTNPNDSTSWGTETNIDSQLGGTRYTDWQLHQLNAMTNDPLVLFYRDEPTAGTDSRWVMSTSTDGGTTFGAQTIIYRVASARSYVVSWSDSQDRIHFIASNSTAAATHVIGHFYYDNGSWFASDGTSLGSPPFDETDLTTIYSGSDFALPSFVAIDTDGTPVATYYTRNASDEYTHWYARWDGSQWNSTELASGLSGVPYEPTTGDTGPLHATPDDGDVNVVYSIEDTGDGNPQVYRYVTVDSGATFSKSAITMGSTGHQGVPSAVRHRGSGLRVLWQFGTLNDYLDYSLGTRGSLR